VEKNRLEAFSDGVIAIILTIMVLDLKVPKEHSLEGLYDSWPIFGAYTLSYWNVFLIWLNHHRIFSALERVDYPLLMANGLLLFLVSLIPFATAFASESHWTQQFPVLLYGLLMAAVSLAFVRLRLAALKHLPDAATQSAHRTEIHISLALVLMFLVGASIAWFIPRSALLLYAMAPLARQFFRKSALAG
jgi:uncharacterized membrane protein